jgi:cytochrome P450
LEKKKLSVVREYCKNLLLDTLACALAGHLGEETPQMAALAAALARTAAPPHDRPRGREGSRATDSLRAKVTLSRRSLRAPGRSETPVLLWGCVTSALDGRRVQGAAVGFAGRSEPPAVSDEGGFYYLRVGLITAFPTRSRSSA